MISGTELPYDVLIGIPEPTRARWQPLRAGILNLFRYDEQNFVFHKGRLLLKGNNGSGKSMALEVLLPYVLDADLTPSRLSTFGGRERSMYLWLLGFDKSERRHSVRAYVWVEFGRRLSDGSCEYFTAGAMLEATRSDKDVKSYYFTTAARLGPDFSVGGPGSEPLGKNDLAVRLAEQSEAGRPGRIHSDAKTHRKAVNDALYKLSDRRFDALRRTLLQLRRPKLSDKLDEKGLNDILRDSLPPIADATVADLADGFERLDRHAAAVGELVETIRHLRTLLHAYGRYARTVGAARADAVVAAESALDAARERADSAKKAFSAAESQLAEIGRRRKGIETRNAEISGRVGALTQLEAYRKGQDVAPLRELVAGLENAARTARENARRLRGIATSEAESSGRATSGAIEARELAADQRAKAQADAIHAFAAELDGDLAARADNVMGCDVADEEALAAVVAEARSLHTRLTKQLDGWASEVAELVALGEASRRDAEVATTARGEVERAETEVRGAEDRVNQCLAQENHSLIAWVEELDSWTEASIQLRAGQAPPLPWDPATALERAPRWAAEARTARTGQLVAEQTRLDQEANDRAAAAAAARTAADRLAELVGLIETAAALAAEHAGSLERYRDELNAWADGLVELPQGLAVPNWAALPIDALPRQAADWTERAEAARARAIVAEQTALGSRIDEARGRVAALAAREERLARQGPPEIEVPATRQASREGRAGAPLFQLVDFAASVTGSDQLGIEAAAIGSGLADAWVSPDGQLLTDADDHLLLDTQLHAAGPRRSGQTLAEALTPDPACDHQGVPAAVVGTLLDRIHLADRALDSSPDLGLVIGRDGSWRAGTLTGAHRVPVVTLIGASNREAARLAALEAVRQELNREKLDLERLAGLGAQLSSALSRLGIEYASVPADDEVRARRDAARDAAVAVTAALPGAKSAVAAATNGPDGESAQDEPARRIQQSLAASWALLRDRVAAESHDTSTPLDELRIEAEALAAAWDAAVAAMRTVAQERRGLIDRVAEEHTSLPDMAPIAQARSQLAGAREAYEGALRRHHLRLEEEQSTAETARSSLQELRSALTANALPEECHLDKLAAAVVRYRNNAGGWLQATVEAVQANGRATITAGRALERGEAVESAETDAAKADQAHREKQTALKTLVDSYGKDFAGIVADLESLEKERATLGAERNELDSSQLDQVKKQTTAEQQEKVALDERQEAEQVRTEANNAFLAACRLGVLTAAGLPDSPAGVDSNRAEQVLAMLEQPSAEAASGLGVRAVRDWARSVRDAAGDLRRDVDAVEHTANRVKEIRYNLEPNLAGQVSVRDEQHHGVLVLHATRSLQTLSLMSMIEALAAELQRFEVLLAKDEAELFRRFLADATRREVTTKIRDARTMIRTMADLMRAHPTSSGITVELRWLPDERNAPGMQEIATLMSKDAPLDSEKQRLQEFFQARIAQVRANPDTDYKGQMAALLDYRQWWRFQVAYSRDLVGTPVLAARGGKEDWEDLNLKSHSMLSGGEKAVCLHLPLFAAAAAYCDSSDLRVTDPDGRDAPGSPRLILLDEVFAGVDEDNRGGLFDIIRSLDLDLVATSESEQGLYTQLDGLAIYQLVTGDNLDAILAARTIWDGRVAHRLLEHDLMAAGPPEPDLFSDP